MTRKKRQGRSDARGTSAAAEIYRRYPGLRGRMTPALPLLFAGCSNSWETADPHAPRMLWLIRKTVAGPAVVSLGMDPPCGTLEIAGTILSGADPIETLKKSIPKDVGIVQIEEQELARRCHALLACQTGTPPRGHESEWLKLVPPLPPGESATPQRYGLADPKAALAPDAVVNVAERMLRELARTFDSAEASCWITPDAFLEFARYLGEQYHSRYEVGGQADSAGTLMLYRVIQFRCQMLLVDLSALRHTTLERRIGDVSAHDVWLSLNRSDPRLGELDGHLTGGFPRMESILLLLEWMQRRGLLLTEPRLPGEWLGWLHRMALEEAAGEPELGSSAMEVLLVDLGFRTISTLRSSARPGIQIPIYVFDVEAGRYLQSRGWAVDEALAALPQGVPCEEAKRRLLRRFTDALAEAGISGAAFLDAFKQQYHERAWTLEDAGPYLRWWRLGHPTRGMCSLVGCVPDPWPRAPEGWQPPLVLEEVVSPEGAREDSSPPPAAQPAEDTSGGADTA